MTNQRTLRAALLRKIDEILLFRTRKKRDRAAHHEFRKRWRWRREQRLLRSRFQARREVN